MSKHITCEALEQYSARFTGDRASRVARDAVMSAGLFKTCQNPMVSRRDNHEFSLSLKQGAITHQKQSGRCWLFAATNVMRFRIIQNYHLENFELSQRNPTGFWRISWTPWTSLWAAASSATFYQTPSATVVSGT